MLIDAVQVGHGPEFAGTAVGIRDQRSVLDDTRTHPCPKGDPHKIQVTGERPVAVLANGKTVGIVVNMNRNSESLFEDRSQRDLFPVGYVQHVIDGSLLPVHQSGHPHTNPPHTVIHQFADQLHDDLHGIHGILR